MRTNLAGGTSGSAGDVDCRCRGLSPRCRHWRSYFLCGGVSRGHRLRGHDLILAVALLGRMAKCLTRLTDYTRSIGTEEPASMAAAGKLLPDVNTMIERLAARLETTPEDIEGWRMLGWSYFHTARYEQAATAYARAVALDPSSAELKLSYEEAKAKASESGNLETALLLADRGRRQKWRRTKRRENYRVRSDASARA